MSWNSLSVPYFAEVCHYVLDGYFIDYGFSVKDNEVTGGVTYTINSIYVDFSYLLEESPHYPVIISIGFVERCSNSETVGLCGIGLWYAIPKDKAAYMYESWRFSDAEELKQTLLRIMDEVINLYARPLWEHPTHLRSLVDKQNIQIQEHYEQESKEQLINQARRAFETRDYSEALRLYAMIPASDLSSSDKRMSYLAHKYLVDNQHKV